VASKAQRIDPLYSDNLHLEHLHPVIDQDPSWSRQRDNLLLPDAGLCEALHKSLSFCQTAQHSSDARRSL